MEFKVYPITEIEKVKKVKRQIQLSRLGIALSHFGEIKGFLISIPEYQKLIGSLLLRTSRNFSFFK